MGKRSRSRQREELVAPTTDASSPEHGTLTLRGVLSPGSRREYADALAGGQGPAVTREDAEARALELLVERLVARWEVAGVETVRQREILQRFRVATPAERAWVRDVLRAHAAEWFPDVRVP